MTYVGPFAFSDTGIQRIVFPETVTYIGRGVCWNCWNLETVVLPSQISVIRDRSFAGCDALLSVQITAPLERVDEMAFAYCSQLNGITLPDSLRIVGNRAFMECYSLEIEKLPASLIYIEDFAFNGTKLQIAELGEKVIYVGKGAFKDCVELQSVVLNEGLLTIEASAFEGCVLLTELEIPDTVEKVGDYFINGTAIEIIELPDGLRFIPYFAGNTVIREVICPSNQIQFLWAKTFEGCTSLEIADVYSGERIGYDCFKGCVSLKYFHAYYKTTLIGDSAFEGCAAMQLITFGGEDSQLETIGEKAFSGCVGITELKLPKTLRTIGSRAFERTSITSIIVPSLVQSIGTGPIYTEMGVLSGYGDSCFYDCPELQKIVFVDRDGAFLPIYSFAEYCPKLAEVYLPSSVGWMCRYNGFDDSYFDRVNEFDYTIDVSKIEALITEKTVAIIPVHVYGNMCDVEKIDEIANKHNLKVIYDAAHAFGVEYKGESSANFGDASMFSFHATKVFNTIEGGAVTYNDAALSQRLDEMKNFGLRGEEGIYVGANAKMNEFQAAMGICNLRHIEGEIAKRKNAVERYRERLGEVKRSTLCQEQKDVKSNYAYFPVVFDGYKYNRDEVFERLKENGIIARKYF